MFKLIQDHTKARRGDLFITSHKGSIDRAIRIFTTSRSSHVGIILDSNTIMHRDEDGRFSHSETIWETIEAFPPKVDNRTRSSLNDFFLTEKLQSKKHRIGIIAVYRPVNRSPEMVEDALLRIEELKGKLYDFLAIWRIGLLRLNRMFPFIATPLMKIFPWKNVEKWYICSEKANIYLKYLNYHIHKESYCVTPSDIDDHCFQRLVDVQL